MKEANRAELLWRAIASIGSVASFPKLLTFRHIFVPSDAFTSDIFNGELPARVLIGEAFRSGNIPLWTPLLGGGYPIGAGLIGDPLGVLCFTLFPPAAALSAFLLTLLMVAAHGTFSLAKRLGASPAGAAFAAIAFAGSGYFVSQLRHLSVLGTVAWLPVGLYVLDRALGENRGERTEPSSAKRQQSLAIFGFVVALQALAGFPQSLYICAIVYGIYAFGLLGVRLYAGKSIGETVALAFGSLFALVLGAFSGSLTLMPIRELATASGRDENFTWFWINRLRYRFADLWSFVFPYPNGDASNMTYRGSTLFWEVHTYAGFLTFVLALGGLVLLRRHLRLTLLFVATLFSLIVALGTATPLFRFLWDYFPLLNSFRFPTRFLVVPDLFLALLAGVTLSQLSKLFSRKFGKKALWTTSAAIVLLAGDLYYHQQRQNPFVPAKDWLAEPAVAGRIKRSAPYVRIRSLAYDVYHRHAFRSSPGWSDVAPYYALRDSLPPNIAALWAVPSINIYAGTAPEHWATVWGDQAHQSLFNAQERVNSDGTALISPLQERLLKIFGVTHLISAGRVMVTTLAELEAPPNGPYVYAVGGERARWIPNARFVANDHEAAALLAQGRFDPNATVLLAGPPLEVLPGSPLPPAGSAPLRVLDLSPNHVRVLLPPVSGGSLFLSDTFYPGWSAEVDGKPAPLLRAHIAGRAVPLPSEAKVVDFYFESPAQEAGALVTGAGLLLLSLYFGLAWISERRGVAKPTAS